MGLYVSSLKFLLPGFCLIDIRSYDIIGILNAAGAKGTFFFSMYISYSSELELLTRLQMAIIVGIEF